MKTFTTLLLLSTLLIIPTTQSACKSMGTVQRELNTTFKGIFSKKTLKGFAQEAREISTKPGFSLYQLNTIPKLYLRKAKSTKAALESVELLQKLTTAYGDEYKPFTYYLNCIDLGSYHILVFKNFENGRLKKVWFYNLFMGNTTLRHRLLVLKDYLVMVAKMNEMGIIAQGLTYHDFDFLPIKNSEYLYRPNAWLFDNLSTKPITYNKTKEDVFMSPEERLNSTVEANSMVYNLVYTYIVIEVKSAIEEKSREEQQEFLDINEHLELKENNDKMVALLTAFTNDSPNSEDWGKLIRGAMTFDYKKRSTAKQALVHVQTLLDANPAPLPKVVPVEKKRKLVL